MSAPDVPSPEMRVVLVDDEAPARGKLRRFLSAEAGARVVGEAASGPEAVRVIREIAPDVVFLDIQMPGIDGFGVVEAIGPADMPDVIFVTAHDEHAIRAFEVHALDYLLKPVAPARFRTTLERVRGRLADRRHRETTTDVSRRLAELLRGRGASQPFLSRVLVDDGRCSTFLPVDQIDRIEAERNYVRLHAGRASYVLRMTVTALAERLDPTAFLRANRSTLVRLAGVRAVHPWSHGDYRLVLADGTTVTWSRRYRAQANGQFGPA